MTNILTQPEPQIEDEDETALAEIWEDIQYLRTLMDADQIEIERLQAESRRLKAETDELRMETRAILTSLKELVKPC